MMKPISWMIQRLHDWKSWNGNGKPMSVCGWSEGYPAPDAHLHWAGKAPPRHFPRRHAHLGVWSPKSIPWPPRSLKKPLVDFSYWLVSICWNLMDCLPSNPGQLEITKPDSKILYPGDVLLWLHNLGPFGIKNCLNWHVIKCVDPTNQVPTDAEIQWTLRWSASKTASRCLNHLPLPASIYPSIHPSEFESDYLSIFTAAGFAAGSAAGSLASCSCFSSSCVVVHRSHHVINQRRNMYATTSIHEMAVMLMLRKLVWKFKAQASFFCCLPSEDPTDSSFFKLFLAKTVLQRWPCLRSWASRCRLKPCTNAWRNSLKG